MKKQSVILNCKKGFKIKIFPILNYIKYSSFTDENNYIAYGITGENTHLIKQIIILNNIFNQITYKINSLDNPNNNCILPTMFLDVHSNFKPFWNNKIQKISNKLFLPINDKLQKLDNKDPFINEYISTDQKNYKLKIKENEKEKIELTKCKKIKLFLTNEQKKYMNIIIGTYRYFYNRTIEFLGNINKVPKLSWYYINPSDVDTRKFIHLSNNDNYSNFINMRKRLKQYMPNWILPNFPSHIIDDAIKEGLTNYNTCISEFKKKRKYFKLSFKSKKDIHQSFKIEEQYIKQNGIFVCWFINYNNLSEQEINEKRKKLQKEHKSIKELNLFSTIKSSEPFINNPLGSTLIYNKILQEYYINLTYKTLSTPTKVKNICAIDPGVRTPLTVYSHNKVANIGNNLQEKMFKICHEMDIIKSRIDSSEYYVLKDSSKIVHKVTPKRKACLRKALHRKIKELKNLKDEFHNKSINYLCKGYNTILFPPFETQRMAGKLYSTVARQMYNLSFYQLRTKLRSKCKENNIMLHELSEAFTSITCTKCGNLNRNLGSNKIYNCPKCNIIIDRDLNGARNILLRNIDCI